MKLNKANQLIEQIEKMVKNEGFEAGKIVSMLKELREIAKEEEDPLIVKVTRLTYEHIEEEGDFNVTFMDDREADDISDFEYLMELIKDSKNQYNRDELRELAAFLKGNPA